MRVQVLSPHCPVTLSVLFRFHPAVHHLLQRCALLLRLLLPFPYLWHPYHHHPAGALQEPELQQELRREEWGAPVVDQGTTPQLLPHLPGAPCAQYPPRSHRLRGPLAVISHRGAEALPTASCSAIRQRTAPDLWGAPTERGRTCEAFGVTAQPEADRL